MGRGKNWVWYIVKCLEGIFLLDRMCDFFYCRENTEADLKDLYLRQLLYGESGYSYSAYVNFGDSYQNLCDAC